MRESCLRLAENLVSWSEGAGPLPLRRPTPRRFVPTEVVSVDSFARWPHTLCIPACCPRVSKTKLPHNMHAPWAYSLHLVVHMCVAVCTMAHCRCGDARFVWHYSSHILKKKLQIQKLRWLKKSKGVALLKPGGLLICDVLNGVFWECRSFKLI